MKPVLDPIDRVSEVIFGVLMAMTFIGALNVASAGREEARTVMLAARLVALAMLFLGGWLLARYAGGNRWLAGFGMAAVGALLVGALIALGG